MERANRQRLREDGQKTPDDLANAISQLDQHRNDRLPFAGLAENYLKFKLRIHMHWHHSGTVDSEKYCTVFTRATRGEVTRAGGVWKEAFNGDDARNINPGIREGRCYRQSVLVYDVKFMKGPELWIPSFVWAQSLKDGVRCTTDCLYSLYRCILEPYPRLMDREHEGLVGGDIVGNCQLPHEMIETGTQIVNSIAQDGQQSRRTLFDDLRFEFVVSRLRIVIRDGLIGITGNEGCDLGIQIDDVLIGPFNFGCD